MSDYTVVYFSGIDRGFSIPSVLAEFTLFGHQMTIMWYGVLIAIGFVLALVAATKLAKKQDMDVEKFYDAVIYGTIFAIIGARLYYVLFEWSYYSQHPSDILKIYEGGLAIYGGLIGAILAALVVCKINKTSFLKTLDVASVGFLIGQGIGRWGNFTNQEAFGTNTTMPWGMTSKKIQEYIISHQAEFEANGFSVDPDIPVHPTFLYESLWCILGAILLYYVCSKYKKFDGQIILSYGVWYGLERVVVEGLRTDSLYIGTSGIRVSQVLSGILVIVCFALLIYNFVKIKKASNIKQTEVKEQKQNEESMDIDGEDN